MCRSALEVAATNDTPSDGYRLNVGVCLVNMAGDVFVARRADLGKEFDLAWQMPQGGIDKGEDPSQAAKRELLEETGVSSATILGQTTEWLHYDFPAELMAKWVAEGRGWGGKFKGQAQKWYLMRFEGEESEIDLSGIGQAREFTEYKWLPMDQISKVVVPFKREVYEEVAKQFGPMLIDGETS